MKNKIVNLHVHSHYSMLDGLCSPEEIVDKAVEYGHPAVAITDHGNLCNYAHFYKHARKKNIKPILGVEFYGIMNTENWKKAHATLEGTKGQDAKDLKDRLKKRYHVLLLAKNNIGFRNLNHLVYESYNNFYYKPRIDYKLLERYHEGLICTAACMAGDIQRHIQDKNLDKAEQALMFYKDLFGEDFYLEIQFNEMPIQAEINTKMLELSKTHKVKTILTGDSHYLNDIDNTTHQSLLLLQTKKTYQDLAAGNAWSFDTKKLYFKDYCDYVKDGKIHNPDIKESIIRECAENTFEIESKIEAFEIDRSLKLKDTSPEIHDKDAHLKALCYKALEDGKIKDPKYKAQLDYELGIIKEKKLARYFLVVNEIVSDAKKKMLVGAGRGSAAGSIVNYLLHITEIDPLRFKLLFERFLAIERNDLPDIDIDFENNDQIKNDLISLYGNEVACISSYSTFQMYGLIKDLSRIYNIESADFIDKLNKKIKMELEENEEEGEESGDGTITITFDEAMQKSPTFKGFMKQHPEIEKDLKVLLGKIRNLGKHAAGVIIADNLVDNQPVMNINGILQTSLSEGTREKSLGEFGFVKIDILGLNTLRIINDCLKYAGIKYDEIHPDKIDIEDQAVYEKIFDNFNLMGIFQFESSAIRQLIKKIKPNCFEDLVSINALFRPGPLKSGMAFEYGDRKSGKKQIEYYGSDIVKKVLSPTYGVLVFQEQIMQLGNQLGGLTLSETNVLRKLLDKARKLSDEDKAKLEKLRVKFVDGALKTGIKKADIDFLWGNMAAFAAYGFNRSHSVSYAMIAFQCAYLKTYYPIEYYCALLNSEVDSQYGKIINEMKMNSLEISPIDMNKSESDFSIKDGKIYWGFSKIKGIGDKVAQVIVKSRKHKAFDGLKDFLLRDMDWRVCNKRVIETLIRIGAFSIKQKNTALILSFYENYNEYKNHLPKSQSNWTTEQRDHTIKRIMGETIKKGVKEFTEKEKMDIEIQFYGVNLVYSPFSIPEVKEKVKILIANDKAGGFSDGKRCVIVFFKDIKRFKDKRGRDMAFLSMVDVNGEMVDGIIFASNYVEDFVQDNRVYTVKGNMENKYLIQEYTLVERLKNLRLNI